MYKIIITYLLSTLFISCAPSTDKTVQEQQQEFSFDAVKSISPSIQDGRDTRAYSQDTFTLNGNSRLLMRFESLGDHMPYIQVTDKHKVYARIVVEKKEDIQIAKNALRICPVTKQWFILATWEYAHPFGATGKWSQPGGDYDASTCVTYSQEMQDIDPKNPNNPPQPVDLDERTISFDITQWLIDYPKGRGQNYGLLVLSSQEISIYGDNSTSFSPRIVWKEQHEVETKKPVYPFP